MTVTLQGQVRNWGLVDGTKLICTRSYTTVFTEGKVYTITRNGTYITSDKVGDSHTTTSHFEVLDEHTEQDEPVTSDGGSSSYYELKVNGQKIETQDIIHDVFGNDFDLGNMFKAQVRIQSALQGIGKAGTSIEYDLNKIIYTCEKLKKRHVKTT